ncbi:MAG: hypothetical protein M3Z56_02345 [Bacteroidota bacterium]|nr:hypothetical protein [Bacteroidota bacterium]
MSKYLRLDEYEPEQSGHIIEKIITRKLILPAYDKESTNARTAKHYA